MRISTVEKIQGQEADVVVLCYGINEPEQLKSEVRLVPQSQCNRLLATQCYTD